MGNLTPPSRHSFYPTAATCLSLQPRGPLRPFGPKRGREGQLVVETVPPADGEGPTEGRVGTAQLEALGHPEAVPSQQPGMRVERPVRTAARHSGQAGGDGPHLGPSLGPSGPPGPGTLPLYRPDVHAGLVRGRRVKGTVQGEEGRMANIFRLLPSSYIKDGARRGRCAVGTMDGLMWTASRGTC